MFHPLLIEFWQENKDQLSIYNKPGGCGLASSDFLLFLKTRKGIHNANLVKTGYWNKDGEKVGGWVILDNPDYSLSSFTDNEIKQMKEKGYTPNKLQDRKDFVKEVNMEEDLKMVPHSWIEYQGNILDPSGFLPDGKGQFDNKISSKDKSRYIKFKQPIQVSRIKESIELLSEGVYASYKLSEDSAKALSQWMKESEILEPVSPEDLHVTTTYSKVDLDLKPSEIKNIVVSHKEFEIRTYGRALVLELESDVLEGIHKAALEAGASYEWSTYKPHITLSYNAEANENILPLLFPPTFDITLSHEEVAPLKEEFEMNKYYSFWGVIHIPDGKIILPTIRQRNDERLYSHSSLMKGNSPADFIRFYIEYKDKDNLVMSIEEIRNQDLESLSSLIYKSVKDLDEMLMKDKSKVTKLFELEENEYPILNKLSLEIENYKPHFYSYDTMKFDLLNKKAILNLISKFKIEEEFEMQEWYDFWGWIKSDGTLLLPTEADVISGKTYNHDVIAKRENVYYKDWARFAIETANPQVLAITYSNPRIRLTKETIENLVKGIKEIEQIIIKNSEEITDIFGKKVKLPTKLAVEIFNNDSLAEIPLATITPTKIINILREKGKMEIEEEAPANSVANIATYSKPMSFKTFRRKYK